MKKNIVITTIYHPTEAVRSFSQLEEYNLIVVGDKKTPAIWNCKNTTYVSIEDQLKLDFEIVKVIPFNHYSRKMIGYLLALQNDADYIIDTDDDNIPKEDWYFPEVKGEFDCIDMPCSFVNIYQLFTKQHIWPRGLPLNLINKKLDIKKISCTDYLNVGVWQGLADGSPDVDAIYRLTSDAPCNFTDRSPVVLSKGTVCPFNTQNTLLIKQLFPLLYLPTHVTFRFTDILRGLIAQPIMWLYNYHLGFTSATVIQKRNQHDYMKDFISEIPMYEHCGKIVDIVSKNISVNNSIIDNLYLAVF